MTDADYDFVGATMAADLPSSRFKTYAVGGTVNFSKMSRMPSSYSLYRIVTYGPWRFHIHHSPIALETKLATEQFLCFYYSYESLADVKMLSVYRQSAMTDIIDSLDSLKQKQSQSRIAVDFSNSRKC